MATATRDLDTPLRLAIGTSVDDLAVCHSSFLPLNVSSALTCGECPADGGGEICGCARECQWWQASTDILATFWGHRTSVVVWNPGIFFAPTDRGSELETPRAERVEIYVGPGWRSGNGSKPAHRDPQRPQFWKRDRPIPVVDDLAAHAIPAVRQAERGDLLIGEFHLGPRTLGDSQPLDHRCITSGVDRGHGQPEPAARHPPPGPLRCVGLGTVRVAARRQPVRHEHEVRAPDLYIADPHTPSMSITLAPAQEIPSVRCTGGRSSARCGFIGISFGGLYFAVDDGETDADTAGDLKQRLTFGSASQDRAAFVGIDDTWAASRAGSKNVFDNQVGHLPENERVSEHSHLRKRRPRCGLCACSADPRFRMSNEPVGGRRHNREKRRGCVMTPRTFLPTPTTTAVMWIHTRSAYGRVLCASAGRAQVGHPVRFASRHHGLGIVAGSG